MAADAARSSGSSALYRVAYEEAVRALVEQQGVIESMRGRAGLLLTATAITTSFLAAHALDAGPSLITGMALVAFVGVSVLSLAILWPRHWEFAVPPSKLISRHAGTPGRLGLDDLHWELAVRMDESYVENAETVGRLAMLFQMGSLLLILETVLWIVAIASMA